MELNNTDLKDFLETKVLQYNTIDFIEPDPISVPHRYSLKEDIEIAGFLASSIAWGNRKMITKNGHRMMDLLGNSPYDFVMTHNDYQLERLDGFVHRTFNADDFKYFIKALKHIYTNKGGLENIFTPKTRYPEITLQQLLLSNCQLVLLSSEPYPFKQKHIDEIQQALPNARIILVDGEMFSWYGSRLLEAADYFKELRIKYFM